MSTYTPLPAWPVAALALGVLIGGYVVGPLVGRWLVARALRRLPDTLADFGGED